MSERPGRRGKVTRLNSVRSRQRPRLIVLCGPSHCGKSTLARSLPGQVVSSDQVRAALGVKFSREAPRFWAVFEDLKQTALMLGGDVILDACHLSKRARWHSVQNAEGYYKILVVFDVKPSVLLARARKDRRVAIGEVRRMARDFDRPTLEEAAELGFDEVRVIEGAQIPGSNAHHKEARECTNTTR